MTRMLATYRHKNGSRATVIGEGANLGAAWIDACERAARVLCPASATPGYDMSLIAHKVAE